ncbi:unnamed protein product, partial [Rhizoctonia solani]
MGTQGFFAYRYNGFYYRQYDRWDCDPEAGGESFCGTIPRDPSALEEWIEDTIKMLKGAEIYDGDSDDLDQLESDTCMSPFSSYYLTDNVDWVFLHGTYVQWTYVIDLDNRAFIVNGVDYWRLDNLPDRLGYYYPDSDSEGPEIPDEFLFTEIDLWPPVRYVISERQQKYDALHPIIVPAAEWGAPIWPELSISHQFSIQITHYLLEKTSATFAEAFLSFVRCEVGTFCWDILCASAPALPFFQDDDFMSLDLSPRTLCSGLNNRTHPVYHDIKTLQNNSLFKLKERGSIEYFWVRGCLVTFCVRLFHYIHVVHEVEQMVRKMRLSGVTEFVGIILSSQQELVVVAMDGPTVRHSPVLDIRATDGVPGRATEGRLLLTYLLSPSLGVLPLPWRSVQPCQPRPSFEAPSRVKALPNEVLQMIIHHADMGTYRALCSVSKSIRSICLAHPRIGDYTVLGKVPGSELVFSTLSTKDSEVRRIEMWWEWSQTHDPDRGKWEFREV